MNTAVARRPAFEREGTPSLARTEKPDAKPHDPQPDQGFLMTQRGPLCRSRMQ
jgi:hypothetical protein